MSDLLHIIIPTFNNPQYLDPCVFSILKTGILNEKARLFIVNNGQQPIKEKWGGFKCIEILEPGENLGWERGLDYALKKSDSKFVCFQNDDTFLPTASCRFYQRLLTNFMDWDVSAVGPATTTSSGVQSIYAPTAPFIKTEVNWLIFFTVMLKRADLDSVGGVDTTLPGGDDFDLSMRLRLAGKKLVIDPGAFIIHHGFKTGSRVYGDGYAGVKNGWNSPEMIERTSHALIRKHGFKNFVSYYYNQVVKDVPYTDASPDVEGDIVRSYIQGESILELGCGSQKTIEKAVGIDRVPKGEEIPHLAGQKSVADIVFDVQDKLPVPSESQDTIIARHILEHCIDTIKTIKQWSEALKPGGRLILAVPDESVTSGIPLNMEHCHAFTAESLKSIGDACGLKSLEAKSTGNGTSLVVCFEKPFLTLGTTNGLREVVNV